MQAQSRRLLIWSLAVACFVGALVGAAFVGIAMAKRNLSESPGESSEDQYPVGVIVTVGGKTAPVFFAPEIQPLRDYWFANPSPEQRIEAEDPPGVVQKLEGGIEVRTLRQDADVIEVDVLTGTANGRTGWIHLSQLPPQP